MEWTSTKGTKAGCQGPINKLRQAVGGSEGCPLTIDTLVVLLPSSLHTSATIQDNFTTALGSSCLVFHPLTLLLLVPFQVECSSDGWYAFVPPLLLARPQFFQWLRYLATAQASVGWRECSRHGSSPPRCLCKVHPTSNNWGQEGVGSSRRGLDE